MQVKDDTLRQSLTFYSQMTEQKVHHRLPSPNLVRLRHSLIKSPKTFVSPSSIIEMRQRGTAQRPVEQPFIEHDMVRWFLLRLQGKILRPASQPWIVTTLIVGQLLSDCFGRWLVEHWRKSVLHAAGGLSETCSIGHTHRHLARVTVEGLTDTVVPVVRWDIGGGVIHARLGLAVSYGGHPIPWLPSSPALIISAHLVLDRGEPVHPFAGHAHVVHVVATQLSAARVLLSGHDGTTVHVVSHGEIRLGHGILKVMLSAWVVGHASTSLLHLCIVH